MLLTTPSLPYPHLQSEFLCKTIVMNSVHLISPFPLTAFPFHSFPPPRSSPRRHFSQNAFASPADAANAKITNPGVFPSAAVFRFSARMRLSVSTWKAFWIGLNSQIQISGLSIIRKQSLLHPLVFGQNGLNGQYSRCSAILSIASI